MIRRIINNPKLKVREIDKNEFKNFIKIFRSDYESNRDEVIRAILQTGMSKSSKQAVLSSNPAIKYPRGRYEIETTFADQRLSRSVRNGSQDSGVYTKNRQSDTRGVQRNSSILDTHAGAILTQNTFDTQEHYDTNNDEIVYISNSHQQNGDNYQNSEYLLDRHAGSKGWKPHPKNGISRTVDYGNYPHQRDSREAIPSKNRSQQNEQSRVPYNNQSFFQDQDSQQLHPMNKQNTDNPYDFYRPEKLVQKKTEIRQQRRKLSPEQPMENYMMSSRRSQKHQDARSGPSRERGSNLEVRIPENRSGSTQSYVLIYQSSKEATVDDIKAITQNFSQTLLQNRALFKGSRTEVDFEKSRKSLKNRPIKVNEKNLLLENSFNMKDDHADNASQGVSYPKIASESNKNSRQIIGQNFLGSLVKEEQFNEANLENSSKQSEDSKNESYGIHHGPGEYDCPTYEESSEDEEPVALEELGYQKHQDNPTNDLAHQSSQQQYTDHDHTSEEGSSRKYAHQDYQHSIESSLEGQDGALQYHKGMSASEEQELGDEEAYSDDDGIKEIYDVDQFNDFEENTKRQSSADLERLDKDTNIILVGSDANQKEDDMNRVHVLSRGQRAASSLNGGSQHSDQSVKYRHQIRQSRKDRIFIDQELKKHVQMDQLSRSSMKSKRVNSESSLVSKNVGKYRSKSSTPKAGKRSLNVLNLKPRQPKTGGENQTIEKKIKGQKSSPKQYSHPIFGGNVHKYVNGDSRGFLQQQKPLTIKNSQLGQAIIPNKKPKIIDPKGLFSGRAKVDQSKYIHIDDPENGNQQESIQKVTRSPDLTQDEGILKIHKKPQKNKLSLQADSRLKLTRSDPSKKHKEASKSEKSPSYDRPPEKPASISNNRPDFETEELGLNRSGYNPRKYLDMFLNDQKVLVQNLSSKILAKVKEEFRQKGTNIFLEQNNASQMSHPAEQTGRFLGNNHNQNSQPDFFQKHGEISTQIQSDPKYFPSNGSPLTDQKLANKFLGVIEEYRANKLQLDDRIKFVQDPIQLGTNNVIGTQNVFNYSSICQTKDSPRGTQEFNPSFDLSSKTKLDYLPKSLHKDAPKINLLSPDRENNTELETKFEKINQNQEYTPQRSEEKFSPTQSVRTFVRPILSDQINQKDALEGAFIYVHEKDAVNQEETDYINPEMGRQDFDENKTIPKSKKFQYKPLVRVNLMPCLKKLQDNLKEKLLRQKKGSSRSLQKKEHKKSHGVENKKKHRSISRSRGSQAKDLEIRSSLERNLSQSKAEERQSSLEKIREKTRESQYCQKKYSRPDQAQKQSGNPTIVENTRFGNRSRSVNSNNKEVLERKLKSQQNDIRRSDLRQEHNEPLSKDPEYQIIFSESSVTEDAEKHKEARRKRIVDPRALKFMSEGFNNHVIQSKAKMIARYHDHLAKVGKDQNEPIVPPPKKNSKRYVDKGTQAIESAKGNTKIKNGHQSTLINLKYRKNDSKQMRKILENNFNCGEEIENLKGLANRESFLMKDNPYLGSENLKLLNISQDLLTQPKASLQPNHLAESQIFVQEELRFRQSQNSQEKEFLRQLRESSVSSVKKRMIELKNTSLKLQSLKAQQSEAKSRAKESKWQRRAKEKRLMNQKKNIVVVDVTENLDQRKASVASLHERRARQKMEKILPRKLTSSAKKHSARMVHVSSAKQFQVNDGQEKFQPERYDSLCYIMRLQPKFSHQ